MRTMRYAEQVEAWPSAGRHIMACFDEENIVVYQAYRNEIGRFAAANQVFGGDFSFSRMSWIKPNFLWMMYRSGWGTKGGQEVTLAVTIPRALFDSFLSTAVPSTFTSELYRDADAWKADVRKSDVRLQWDPDHDPNGFPLERRAIQLGLRGKALDRYAREQVVRIDDVSEFVAEQREVLRRDPERLKVPTESVYLPELQAARERVGIDNRQTPETP